MSNFFILGLPRSRTAWLANFMTYDSFSCLHEGTNGCNTMQEYKTKLGSGGDSNTGLVMFNFRKHFPTARTVIIDSGITQAVAYAKHVYNVDTTKMMLDLKEQLDELHGLHVPVDNVDKELSAIWAYLTHDAPFDEKRAELLKSLNVQVQNPYLMNVNAAINLRESENVAI